MGKHLSCAGSLADFLGTWYEVNDEQPQQSSYGHILAGVIFLSA